VNVPPPPVQLDPVKLKSDPSGAFYWNNTPVDELALKAQFAVIAQQTNQPEIQIAADDSVAYQYVAQVLADAKSYNLTKIGFTENF
jgi:biopolymer transport protein ExbD